MADKQPARSATEQVSSAASSSALLQSDQDTDQSLDPELSSSLAGQCEPPRRDDPQAWVLTPSADPSSGHVTEVDQRQVTAPSGHLSARGLTQMAGASHLKVRTGNVTVHATDTAGVVKGLEQHVYQTPVYQAPVYQAPVHQAPVYQAPVYQNPVQHNYYQYHYSVFPPTQAAFDALCQGRAPQLLESSAQSALPPPASPPAGPRLAVPETPPPPERPRLSSQPTQPQAPATVAQLPAAQPAPAMDAVTSLEARVEVQAASLFKQAAEPQGTSPAVEETSSQPSSSSSSLASSQHPWSRTQAEAASGEQGQAWAAGQRPDPVTLPEESPKLKNLIANTRQLIATDSPQGYVDTAALGEMLEGLQQQGVCLVLGLPGHGKTALALQAMGRLAASHHLKPLRLDSPDQWRWIPGETQPHTTQAQQQQQQRRPLPTGERELQDCSEDACQRSRRYIVLIDDVFGKGNYNKVERDSWGKIFDLMLGKVRAGQVRLILVSRVHVFQACDEGLSEHSLFSEACKIDLRKPEYWTEEDNEEILQKVLSQHNVKLSTPVQDIVDAAVECSEIGFPQCCQYFATNPDAQKEGCKFFSHPVSFLQKQLKLLQQKDPKSYLVLVLTWLGGNSLSEEEAAGDPAKLRTVCRQFGVKEELIWTELETTAQSLCGVYLHEVEEGVFQLTHHSLHDCLVVAVCKADLKRALEVCSIGQMCEYVCTKGSSGGHAGLTYTVRRSQWPLLADRLVKAMTSEEVAKAVRHPSLRDKDFVSELVAKHLEPSQRLQLLQKKEKMMSLSPLTALIQQGAHDFSTFLLASREMTELSEEDSSTLLKKALESACLVGDKAMVRDLLDRKAEVTKDTLWAACESKSDDVDTLRALCHHLSSFDLLHEHYGVFLMRCSERGKLQSVQYLLTEARPKDCKHDLNFLIDYLIFRCTEGTGKDFEEILEQIFSVLKTCGTNIPKTSFSLWTAAGLPSSFALEELLSDNTSQEEMYNSQKESLLHMSARGGSLKCLQFLLESPQTRCMDVNGLDEKKRSPLHRAMEGNHLRVAEFLLQHGADPDGGVCLLDRSDAGNASESRDPAGSGDATHTALQDSQVTCEGTTPLHLAARHHHLSLMELLITHKARTDVLNENHRTLLQEYAQGTRPSTREKRKPDEELLRQRLESLIVEKTQDINHQDQGGATALHLAAQSGFLSFVETLLALKARTDVMDKQQRTALHALASSTDNSWETKARKETTASLVAATVDINQGDEEGMTPLHVAAENDNLSTMEVLIEKGARMDAVDRHKRSVLHAYLDRPCCCNVRLSERRRRVEEALLVKMPDMDSVDVEGRTALYMAARCGHVFLMEKLMQHECRQFFKDPGARTLLHVYAMSVEQQNPRTKQWKTVTQRMEKLLFKATVEGGSGINTQDDSGQTALHVAASCHHWTLIESLIQLGARVDVLDENEQTPVHCYAEKWFWSDHTANKNLKERVENLLVKKLSEVGYINHQDKNGYSVLHLACGKEHWNLAKSLLQTGAKVDLLDRHSRTPLHWCADIKYQFASNPEQMLQLEKLLVERMPAEGEVDINAQDTQGSTALHLAAWEANLPLMELLMERDAGCDLLDNKKISVLHSAAASPRFRIIKHEGKERLVRWLMDKSDVTAKADCGCTPLDVARQWDKNTFLVRALEARTASQASNKPDEECSMSPRHCPHKMGLPKLEMEPVSQSKWCPALKYPQALTVKCWTCEKSIQRLRGQRDDRDASSADDG